MAAELEALQRKMRALPPAEQLRLARWLLDQLSTILPPAENRQQNGLSDLVGRYKGGPGDSAERVEEILLEDVKRRVE